MHGKFQQFLPGISKAAASFLVDLEIFPLGVVEKKSIRRLADQISEVLLAFLQFLDALAFGNVVDGACH